jgi:hypothetical protein
VLAADRTALALLSSEVSPGDRVGILAAHDVPLPLSFIEEWCLDQCRHPDGAGGYHVAAWHRLAGPLDPDLFRRSLDAMVARHEMLRTTFRIDPPGHIIHPPRAADLEYLDFTTRHDPLGEAAALFRSVAKKRLDLQEMFGFFTNIAPLRFRTDPSVSFGTWLRQVRDTILAVQSHSRIP